MKTIISDNNYTTSFERKNICNFAWQSQFEQIRLRSVVLHTVLSANTQREVLILLNNADGAERRLSPHCWLVCHVTHRARDSSDFWVRKHKHTASKKADWLIVCVAMQVECTIITPRQTHTHIFILDKCIQLQWKHALTHSIHKR